MRGDAGEHTRPGRCRAQLVAPRLGSPRRALTRPRPVRLVAHALAPGAMLADEEGEARPLLEEALREVGDTLAAVNTREKGIFVGSAVSPPAPTSCGPPRRALSRCRAAARLRSACHPAPAGERRCGTSRMATAFASGTKATPVGARSMLANL